MHYTPRLNTLTDRQQAILRHTAQGLTNEQIATELGCAKSTIKNTMAVIKDRLEANNRTHAVVKAIQEGYI